MMPSDHLEAPPRRVAIIGPECTGKTDLAQKLATHYQTNWVPEYARAYLQRLPHGYGETDLAKIAHGQIRMEDEWMQDAHRVLICDTNLIVIKVWSEYKYGHCDAEILQLLKTRSYDLLLVTDIDIPWEEDPQREHPDKRDFFKSLYLKEAAASGIPFVSVSGTREVRLATATQAIDKILNPA